MVLNGAEALELEAASRQPSRLPPSFASRPLGKVKRDPAVGMVVGIPEQS